MEEAAAIAKATADKTKAGVIEEVANGDWPRRQPHAMGEIEALIEEGIKEARRFLPGFRWRFLQGRCVRLICSTTSPAI